MMPSPRLSNKHDSNIIPAEAYCPNGTFHGLHTCFCEDHCSWQACRLLDPPHNCLSSFNTDVVWAWDFDQMYWVAQGNRVIT